MIGGGVCSVCKGASVIYNCAKPPYTEWAEKFIPMTTNLIIGAEKSGAVFVHADNLYMYGETDGKLTEDLKYKNDNVKGSVKAKMSEMILEAHKNSRIKATIGRASCFFGPLVKESAVGINVLKAAFDGKAAPVLGDIDTPNTYSYIKDFAKALVILGEEEKALGLAWHIPNAETITTRQFISMIYDEFEKEPKFQIATRKMVSFFGIFNKTMREFKELMYMYDKPFVVDCSKFINQFGDISTPHKDAIKDTIDWYKSYVVENN